MDTKQILVVDDEIIVCNTISAYLEAEGFIVQTVNDGLSGLEVAKDGQFDLVILDVMLPRLDGFEVLRQLRQFSNVFVLMLTAKGDEFDKVVGLKLGADDYLTKPFSPRELVARVQAILRRERTSIPDEAQLLRFSHLTIDPAAQIVKKGDEVLGLTPTEFSLLMALTRHKGRVLSREQLIEIVWGYDYFGDTRVIDTHIRRLRSKIEDETDNPYHIVTVRGSGYRFDG
ncbi:MAG: response regulator transcription factor [Caldilineaceae bacterium]|nr:response regulator transcription factor [Caldilineaceae bacterium]